ncbi:TPA: hypothetical protein N0F65_004526 [Lagenidium giganteum]|uniref:Peroxisomal membrane protein PEX16 n=1 Tax=Lagenidium giganteum TaxID=4803 RepID=A0AAV2YWI4_9STRA|nr:TPA: hypothetical protein N0F65_004526 [Lagenidium giganteum]
MSTANENPDVMVPPSGTTTAASRELIRKYEAWVCANPAIARNMESLFYIAPQLAPKWLGDRDVMTELGYSFVGLLRLFHDHILYKSTATDTGASSIVRAARVPLSVLSHVQVFAEVLARKLGGEASKWRVIVVIECVKMICRVVLLLQRRRAMLIAGGKYKAIEVTPVAADQLSAKKSVGARTGKSFANPSASRTPPKQPTLPTIVSFNDATIAVHNNSENRVLAGELLHILRPPVYALLLSRSRSQSWGPLLVSLAMELSSLALTTPLPSDQPAPPAPPMLTKLHADEVSSRKLALLMYLLRDPVFATATKPVANKISDLFDPVPLVGKIVRYASTGILDYYHQYYFYTSAS